MIRVSLSALYLSLLALSLAACGVDEPISRTQPDPTELQDDSIEPVVNTEGSDATNQNPTPGETEDSSVTPDSASDTTAETTTEAETPTTPEAPAITPVVVPLPLPWYEELLGAEGVMGSWYCGSVLDSQITETNNPVNWEEALIIDWTLPVNEMRFNNDRTVASGPILGTNIFGTYWYQTNNNGKNVTIQWSRGGYIELYFNEQNTEQMMGGGTFCSRLYPSIQ